VPSEKKLDKVVSPNRFCHRLKIFVFFSNVCKVEPGCKEVYGCINILI